MKFWIARNGNWIDNLKECEVERQTNSFVWVKGSRRAKRSPFDNYFESKIEALDFLLNDANKRLSEATDALRSADEYREKILSLY